MNCKPGDLAIVIKSERRDDTTGAIVRVLRRYSGSLERFGPAWWVEYLGSEWHAVDAHLRPLRDPGEDATDETMLWLPSPTKQGEPA
jgi:hypothetical protein